VRLTVPAQQVQEGGFVVIESGDWLFYGLVTDLRLGATDVRFADEHSEARFPPELAKLLQGSTLYTTLEVLPALMLERGPELDSPEYTAWMQAIESGLKDEPGPLPVKTIPPHHASVRLAGAHDIAGIFGKVEKKSNFVIGYTREQEHPVCLNLDKFVQRSAGVFGATGTGKSFLTRILLAGMIRYDQASLLVFDMHNEYGLDDTASDTGEAITGLRTKFPGQVRVVGLGKGALIRGNVPDFNLEFAYDDIQPQDIELLTRELNLKETTPTTMDALVTTFGTLGWFKEFMNMKSGANIVDESGKKQPAPSSVAAWANSSGVNVMAAEGLHRAWERSLMLWKQGSISCSRSGSMKVIWITFWSATCSRGKFVSVGKHEQTLSDPQEKMNPVHWCSSWKKRTSCSTVRWPPKPHSAPSRVNCASIMSRC